MLGVNASTVNRDLQPVANASKPESEAAPIKDNDNDDVANASKPTTIATQWAGDQEGYTPEKYIESARLVMGSIDIDPASNEYANKTVRGVQLSEVMEAISPNFTKTDRLRGHISNDL